MRRIMLLTVSAIAAVMLVAMAAPAFAQGNFDCRVNEATGEIRCSGGGPNEEGPGGGGGTVTLQPVSGSSTFLFEAAGGGGGPGGGEGGKCTGFFNALFLGFIIVEECKGSAEEPFFAD